MWKLFTKQYSYRFLTYKARVTQWLLINVVTARSSFSSFLIVVFECAAIYRPSYVFQDGNILLLAFWEKVPGRPAMLSFQSLKKLRKVYIRQPEKSWVTDRRVRCKEWLPLLKMFSCATRINTVKKGIHHFKQILCSLFIWRSKLPQPRSHSSTQYVGC